MLTTPPEGLLDDVGRLLGPDERGGMGVPLGEIALDVSDQGLHCRAGSPDRNGNRGCVRLSA
jgi:hypothetical protein